MEEEVILTRSKMVVVGMLKVVEGTCSSEEVMVMVMEVAETCNNWEVGVVICMVMVVIEICRSKMVA